MAPTIAQLDAFVSSSAYDAQTAGLIASMIPALKADGELISPGVRRIRGNLCNVHGKYGPCDKVLKKPKGGKRAPRGKKPAKPKVTTEQRAQADTNRSAVYDKLGVSDAAITAINALEAGDQPANADELIAQGLAARGQDGAVRMTAAGRQFGHAADRGDAGAARDAISAGTDQHAARTTRQSAAQARAADVAKRRQDAVGKRVAAQIGAAFPKRKPIKAKPAKATPAPAAAKPARAAFTPPPPRRGTASASTGGGSGGSARPKPPAPIKAPAPTKAPPKKLAPALTEAATALSEGADVTDAQVLDLVRNGLVKLNKDGTPVLTAAGQRATMKDYAMDIYDMQTWVTQRTTTKAQTAQDKAMFAKMGGGGSGGSGGKGSGSSEGKSTLWAKGPSGKRTPQAGADPNQSGFRAKFDSRMAAWERDHPEPKKPNYSLDMGAQLNIKRAYRKWLEAQTAATREIQLDLMSSTKAQTAQDKAMFAKMGGGGSGSSGGKGSAGGGSKLWPKGPNGKRTPQAAAAETRGKGSGVDSALSNVSGSQLDTAKRQPGWQQKYDKAIADGAPRGDEAARVAAMTPSQRRTYDDARSVTPSHTGDAIKKRDQSAAEQQAQMFERRARDARADGDEAAAKRHDALAQEVRATQGGAKADPHAPSTADRAVADRARALSAKDNDLSSQMTDLRKQHEALNPSWGQTLKPKYEKERQAKQADLQAKIDTLRTERNRVQQQSQELQQHPEGRAAMDRVVRQEIVARRQAGKPMPGDDVTLRMIEEQHGIRAPQPLRPGEAPQMITRNPDRARAANTEYQGRANEARGLQRQAVQARADADRMEATNPTLALQLRQSAADNQWRAHNLTSGPRSMELLGDIEASGYQMNSSGRGVTPAKPSTTPKMKDASFRVFKDAHGEHRWVAQSSTAYQDRDHEIVSTKALADDCVFADSTGSYGPLRWWHTPGLDLGDCDFNAMSGRVLIESGTFRSAAIAQKVAQATAGLEISLGFLHLSSEPDADGVFHHIRRFERSLVPRGKASNRFTAFTVKERPMLDETKKAALKSLGFSDEDIMGLQAQAQATEKSATDQGVAYKADEPDMIINGVTYKAFPAKADEGSPEEEAAESPEEESMEPDAEDPTDENALTLSAGDMAAIGELINGAITQIMGGLNLEKKVADHVQGLLAPMATKEATLTTQVAELTTQLKELTGDQPSAPYRATGARDNLLTDAAMLAAVKQATDQNNNDPWADIKMGLGIQRST